MKKLFALLHLCAAIGFSQNAVRTTPVRQLIESDFILSEGRMSVSSLPCQLANSFTTDNVSVSVICQLQAFRSLGVNRINEMIVTGNDKVRGTVNVLHNYLPAEIKMAYNPELKSWSMTNLYSVTDDQGITKESMLSLDFDANGKFLLMKRIF